jgi:radical SAM superfamily enzyme YgiQ (UPF0313 family)
MSKILLVNPRYGRLFQRIKGSEWIAPPLGLAYLAAVLEKAGHEVKIFDMQVEKTTINDALKPFGPEVVGVYFSTPFFTDVIKVLTEVKQFNPKIVTMVGGPHPTVLPEETAKQECIDFVVFGEGEETIIELIQKYKGKELTDIKGIAYKKNRKVIVNPPRPLIKNLDQLPFPAHHLLKIGEYSHPLMHGRKIMSILTSRGCPYCCIFCNKSIFGSYFRARSAKNVVDEIEILVKKYGIDEIHIIDDNFTVNRKRVIEICEDIIRRNLKIKWSTPNGIRADTVNRRLIKLMKRSGCYSLSFGIESASPKILESINKNIKLSTIKKVFKICRSEKIETIAFFIIGFPGETAEDIQKTIDFAKDIKPDVADFHTLIPLPGTPVYKYLKENDLLLEKDWSKYSFHINPVYRTKELSKEEIAELYHRAYKEFYTDPKYLLSRISKMTTISGIRNNLRGFKTIFNSFIFRK